MENSEEVENPEVPLLLNRYRAEPWRMDRAKETPNSYYETSLSSKLGLLAARGGDGFSAAASADFSWTNPEPLYQLNEPHCIAYAVKAVIDLQMNIIPRLDAEGEDINQPLGVPQISLNYLTTRLGLLEHPTMPLLLEYLNDNGFVDQDTPFDVDTGETAPDARKFYLHWSMGFCLRSYMKAARDTEVDMLTLYSRAIKECITEMGGVVAEFLITSLFSKTGATVVTSAGRRLTTATKTKSGKTRRRRLAHAVVLVGWRTTANGTVEFRFLNSHGAGYGENGFNWVRANATVHVYAPQVLEWWD